MSTISRIALVLVSALVLAVVGVAGYVVRDIHPSLPARAATSTATTTATPVPTKTSTPWPTATLGPTTSITMPGFYRHCEPDKKYPTLFTCTDYPDSVTLTRDNCGEAYCLTTIKFTTAWGDHNTMWVDFFQSRTSVKVKNGDELMMPDINDLSLYGISVRPFFFTSPTPRP